MAKGSERISFWRETLQEASEAKHARDTYFSNSEPTRFKSLGNSFNLLEEEELRLEANAAIDLLAMPMVYKGRISQHTRVKSSPFSVQFFANRFPYQQKKKGKNDQFFVLQKANLENLKTVFSLLYISTNFPTSVSIGCGKLLIRRKMFH